MDDYRRLYGGIEFEPHNGEAMVDAWTLPSIISGVQGLIQGGKLAAGLYPYRKDIWNGRDLLFHKPFKWMSKDEQGVYYKRGKTFYKQNIQPHIEHNNLIGDVNFPGNQAGKTNYKNMEQYPFLRYNIKNTTDNIPMPNNKPREDANGFHNLKVNWLGKDYVYQIKNNAYNNQKYFHNIKPYDIEKTQRERDTIGGLIDFYRNKLKK